MYSIKRKRIIICTAVFIAAAIFSVAGYTLSMPDEITLFEDEIKTVDLSFPFSLSGDSAVSVMASDGGGFLKNSVSIASGEEKEAKLYFTLFDKITLKEIDVSVKDREIIIPGGQSIGVRMNVNGVIVVGMENIPVSSEDSVNPCINSGLQIGDNITEINGEKIYSAMQVREIVNDAPEGEKIRIKAKRNGENVTAEVVPVFSFDEKTYRLGLWVRDRTAGIGTLTFYNPDDGSYGALGHGIADPDTGVLLDAADGEILYSKVVSVKQGASGSPGEVRGIFYESNHPLGTVVMNSKFGVFGRSYDEIKNAAAGKPMEIGYQSEVQKGKASVLTTIDGEGVKEYEIEIQKINRQISPSTKSMVIKITDEELLEKSGGIVQGMGVIDNRDNTKKPENKGFSTVTLN
ncbi:MAG: SpoIVB peptidase [Bacillota bacterium]|nr:SpoIVB peptidase [Bacillota bacterium]